jgi:hypothetical protein
VLAAIFLLIAASRLRSSALYGSATLSKMAT